MMKTDGPTLQKVMEFESRCNNSDDINELPTTPNETTTKGKAKKT